MGLEDGEEDIYAETSYSNILSDYIKKVNSKMNKAKELCKTITDDKSKAELIERIKSPHQTLMIDCSLSQFHTFPTSCTLALLFADARAKASSPEELSAAPPAMLLFSSRDPTICYIPMAGSVNARVKALVETCRKYGETVDVTKSDVDYDAALRVSDVQVSFMTFDLVVTSDFRNSEAFAHAVEASYKRIPRSISAWMMLKQNSKKRTRAPAWDPKKPLIDLCFVLDTTGSMSSSISYCKTQIMGLLTMIETAVHIKVRASFVSYKDFGNDRYLEKFEWISANDGVGINSLLFYQTEDW